MNLKKIAALLTGLSLVGCSMSSSDEIIVTNNSQLSRVGEMVEVEMALLETYEALEEGEIFIVRDQQGEVVPTQMTYDGKLIFQCDVEAETEAHFTVEKSRKEVVFQNYACGRVYPQRVDDVAWESDLIAFRAYGPALQKSGERAFGYDVWVKNNTELPVVEERYNKELNPETKAKIAALRESDPAAADALYASVSYHNDHGNGLDAYKVGPTLGGGATAIIEKGRIIYPYCYKECEILDNGPLRFTARLTYHPTKLADGEVTEQRTISIDKGSFLNRTTVEYVGTMEQPIDVMAGIVLHESTPRTLFNEQMGYVTYAEPVEAPDGGELYLAMYFPEEWCGAENRLWTRRDDKPAGTFGHAAVYNKIGVGEKLTYYWGALWSKSTLVEVPNKEAFDVVVERVAKAKQSPLEVTTVVYKR